MATVTMIVPCYNEEHGVRNVMERANKLNCLTEVLVVDNNSKDNTAKVASSLGARVILETLQGYGAAYKAGFIFAPDGIIITMDGDGTYPIEEITRILDLFEREKLDFISCSRFPLHNKKAMSKRNRFGNSVLTLVTNLLFGLNLSDSQSGMWVFKKDCLRYIFPSCNGMGLSEEIKINAFSNKRLKAKEVWIPYHERVGKSKLFTWRDGFSNLLFLFKKRLGKLL